MDRIDAMRSFVRVVDTGSFTQAALSLGLGKTSVSEHVARLEAELGVRLLHRTTRAVVVTPEGEQYAAKARALLALFDDTQASVKTSGQQVHGVVRVDVPTTIGQAMVIPRLEALYVSHPQLVIELHCSDSFSDVVADGLDCVVRAGMLPDSSMVCRKIGEIGFSLFAAPAYLARRGTPLVLADLPDHHHIGYRNRGSRKPFADGLRQGGHTEPFTPAYRLVLSDAVSAVLACVQGLGILYASHFAVLPYLRSGALVRVLPDWQGGTLPLQLLSPTNRSRTRRVQVVMGWLDETVRAELAAP